MRKAGTVLLVANTPVAADIAASPRACVSEVMLIPAGYTVSGHLIETDAVSSPAIYAGVLEHICI